MNVFQKSSSPSSQSSSPPNQSQQRFTQFAPQRRNNNGNNIDSNMETYCTVNRLTCLFRRNDLVAMFSFNTAMMQREKPDLKIRFTKPEIDKVNNDKRFFFKTYYKSWRWRVRSLRSFINSPKKFNVNIKIASFDVLLLFYFSNLNLCMMLK